MFKNFHLLCTVYSCINVYNYFYDIFFLQPAAFVYVGLWEYIEQTRDMIHDLEKRLQKSKDNIADILKIMSVWAKSPLFERKEGKLDSLLDIQGRENALKSKADLITQDGEKIHALVAENKALLKVHNDQGPDWMAYVDVVDAKVVKGFFDCVNTSLDYFLDNLGRYTVHHSYRKEQC